MAALLVVVTLVAVGRCDTCGMESLAKLYCWVADGAGAEHCQTVLTIGLVLPPSDLYGERGVV